MSFASLIKPWNLERFRDEIWGQRVLHLAGGARAGLGSIVTGDEVRDLLFGGEGLPLEAVHAARGTSREMTPSLMDKGEALTDPARLAVLNGSGQTLMVERVERFVPSVAHWARAIAMELHARTLVHLIVSPAGEPGFAPHSDGYGVFALQIEGSKLWSIYGEVPQDPPQQGADRHELLTSEPTQVIRMQAGDLLYLPRGVVHAAAGLEGGSIHLSLAVMPARGVDLISLLARTADRDALFRQELPFGTGPGSQPAQGYIAEFADQLETLIRQADWFGMLDARLAEQQKCGEQP